MSGCWLDAFVPEACCAADTTAAFYQRKVVGVLRIGFTPEFFISTRSRHMPASGSYSEAEHLHPFLPRGADEGDCKYGRELKDRHRSELEISAKLRSTDRDKQEGNRRQRPYIHGPIGKDP
jgi:hypothetical protein